MRALVLAGPDDSGAKSGFVLKHTREDIYAATLAVPKSEPLFSPIGIFPKRRDGGLRLPSQYRLEAIYFNSWYETNDISARETWLASAFLRRRRWWPLPARPGRRWPSRTRPVA